MAAQHSWSNATASYAVDHFGGEKQFLRQQSYDNKKREYCKQHNLKLIEIPYWDFDKINSEYLLNLIK